MLVIGHRGAAALAPENTLEGIEAAVRARSDGVEIDVRLSADGVLVLMHDPDVARTTSGTGRVDASTAKELARLGVPALDDVLEAAPAELLLVVEVKGNPWEAGHDAGEPVAHALATTLAERGSRRIVVSSFNPAALAIVREKAPGVRTAVLTSAGFDPASNLAAAVAGGHDECHVPAQILEESFVERARAAGRAVVAWTVNDALTLRAFRSWGVDGAITDDPAAARAVLAG
jgi:glycerophosphoryl diester phosphodiesterase